MKTMGMMLTALLVSGCASLSRETAERVDLGDGLVFDLIPVSAVAAGANALQPGAGSVVQQVERKLAAKREARLGPFNGLPFTTTRSVILKNGTVISEGEIAKIVETLTPIVPEPVTRVIAPSEFGTTGTAAPETLGTTNREEAQKAQGTNVAATVGELLEEIGGAK